MFPQTWWQTSETETPQTWWQTSKTDSEIIPQKKPSKNKYINMLPQTWWQTSETPQTWWQTSKTDYMLAKIALGIHESQTTEIKSESTQSLKRDTNATLSPEDVSRLKASGRVLLAIKGIWYDVTEFMSKHPGGAAILRASSMKVDATANFLAVHDVAMLDAPNLRALQVGRVLVEQQTGVDTASLTAKTDASGAAATKWWDRCTSAELEGLMSVASVRKEAESRLPANLVLHWNNGNEDNESLESNEAAWSRLALMPRVCVDVRRPELSTTILGCAVSSPIFVAPFATAGAAHTDGEVLIARSCASSGRAYVCPHYCSSPLRDVADAYMSKSKAEGSAPLFFQLYAPALSDGSLHREYTAAAFRHAHECGYQAVMVTVDSAVVGIREQTYGNPEWVASLSSLPGGGFPPNRGFEEVDDRFGACRSKCASVTWADVKWMVACSKLKVVVKGIMHPEDAAEAVRAGVTAIVVSNHGGRQMDGCAGTAAVLRECVTAVRSTAKAIGANEVEVYVDGGIRRGKDVLRALALGARGVMVGRPVLWGLAVGGQEGVSKVLDLLHTELKNALQLCGQTSVRSVQKSVIRRSRL